MKKDKNKSTRSADLRKRAKDARRETEVSVQTLLQNIQAAVIVHSSDKQIVACNTAAQELLGLTEDQMIGESVASPDWKYLTEDGSVMPAKNYPVQQVLAKRKTIKDLIIGISRPGKRKIQWILVNANPIVDNEGNISHVIVTFMDITGHKIAEEALRESEEKYRQLIENLQEGVWVIDNKANTTIINPRMAEMLGYTVDEMMGKHLFTFMDEHNVEIAKKYLKHRKKGIIEQHDFEFLRKDGEKMYASLETNPLTDDQGNYIGALACVANITERKMAEESLRKSEERYRSIFNTAAISIWEKDFSRAKEIIDELKTQGITDFRTYLNEHPEVVKEAALAAKTLDVNDMTLKLYGARTKEELLVPTGTRMVEESLELLRESMIAVTEGKTYYEGETVNQTVDGRLIDVLIHVNIPVEKEQFKVIIPEDIRIKAKKALDRMLNVA